jgi:hypothetical protein
MGTRSYALLTSQTITQTIMMVPIIPYPNIVPSLESKTLGLKIPMNQLAPLVPRWMPHSAQNPNSS